MSSQFYDKEKKLKDDYHRDDIEIKFSLLHSIIIITIIVSSALIIGLLHDLGYKKDIQSYITKLD